MSSLMVLIFARDLISRFLLSKIAFREDLISRFFGKNEFREDLISRTTSVKMKT